MAGVLVAVALGGFGALLKPPAGSEKEAPEFRLKDFQGREHALSEWRGRPVVVHFWASWCAPCLDEIPMWLEAARAAEDKPTRWIAISLDDSWKDAHKILPNEKLPRNVVSLLDVDRASSDKFGSFQFPESYWVDGAGQILKKWVGPQDWKEIGKKIQLSGPL